ALRAYTLKRQGLTTVMLHRQVAAMVTPELPATMRSHLSDTQKIMVAARGLTPVLSFALDEAQLREATLCVLYVKEVAVYYTAGGTRLGRARWQDDPEANAIMSLMLKLGAEREISVVPLYAVSPDAAATIVDNVDVEAATRRGVVVLNAPGGNTVSTAEHAFSLLLCVARKIPQADAIVRGGKWDRKNLEGVELYNKMLGVVGMGRIGSELSRRAIAFGMRVIAYDPYLSATRARSLQVELVDELDDLLTHADFISLHTPLTAETRHILDATRLQKTRRGVRIINCARGGLIDEPALVKALQDVQVAAAALDVFETEPLPADSPLRSAPNLV